MIEFTTLLFYMFSALTLGAGVMVVFSRNPVYSVLWLIFAFFNSAGLFILLGAEMLAMLLVIVYVGAVAVLFLFVVMMLNIKTGEAKKSVQAYFPVGLILAAILCVEMIMVMNASVHNQVPVEASPIGADAAEGVTNAHAIGNVLYTEYVMYFQLCGLILLVAMIGAIVLTLRHRSGVRRQKASDQNKRSRADTLRIVNVETGRGVDGI